MLTWRRLSLQKPTSNQCQRCKEERNNDWKSDKWVALGLPLVLSFTLPSLSRYPCGHAPWLPAAIAWFHRHSQPAQVGRGGGRGLVFTLYSSSSSWITSTLHVADAAAVKSAVHWQFSIAHGQTAGPAPAIHCSRFPRESSRFHSRQFRNENVQESRAPGKREPGNEFPE